VSESRYFETRGLRLHYLDWGGEGPVVILAHGLLEHAHAFDRLAPLLRDAGYHPVALDWRGHGDSDWGGAGAYYHFAEYVADLGFLVRHLGGQVCLVGHSMGGNVSLQYAGTEPERVLAMVNIEGLGPPGADFSVAPATFAKWIDDHVQVEGRILRPFAREAAERRLHEGFPLLDESAARHMVLHGTRSVDGGYLWKYDPVHRTTSPQPYYSQQAWEFWKRVECPMLYVDGGSSAVAMSMAEIAGRVEATGAQRVTLPGVRHHPHLECPEDLAVLIADFFRKSAAGGKA